MVLESELRTKTDSQIVVHSVVEEDVVTNFGAHSDRSGKGLDAASRIQSEIGRAGSQSYSVGESGRRAGIGDRKVFKSYFAGYK